MVILSPIGLYVQVIAGILYRLLALLLKAHEDEGQEGLLADVWMSPCLGGRMLMNGRGTRIERVGSSYNSKLTAIFNARKVKSDHHSKARQKSLKENEL